MKLIIIIPSPAPLASPAYGPAVLKSYLEQKGHTVKVLDLNLRFMHECLDNWPGLLRKAGVSSGGRLESFLRKILLSLHLDKKKRWKESVAIEAVLKTLSSQDCGSTLKFFTGHHGDFFSGSHDNEKYNLCLGSMDFAREWLTAHTWHAWFLKGNGQPPPHIQNYLDEIEAMRPDVIGFSLHGYTQLPFTLGLARMAKERIKVPIILGGSCFASSGNWNPSISQQLMAKRQFIDGIFYGEAEESLKAFLDGDDVERIPGVSFRKNGVIINTTPPTHAISLENMPLPDFSDTDKKAYLSPIKVLPILTSRGCYWKRCAFCSHHRTQGAAYRERSIVSVINEMCGDKKKYGTRVFYICDEMLSASRARHLAEAILMCEELADIYYLFYAKPTSDYSNTTLELLSKSGCVAIFWGLESASQRLLDFVDKGTKLTEATRVFQKCKGANISNWLFIMYGLPTETKEEAQATVDFLVRHQRLFDYFSPSQFVLTAESRMAERPEEYGIRIGGRLPLVSSILKEHPRLFRPNQATGLLGLNLALDWGPIKDQPEVSDLFQKVRPFSPMKWPGRFGHGWIFREHLLVSLAKERGRI